jgi:hypothetical protein
MDLTISQLKQKWEKENESYKKSEVGSGSQKFVKEILKSQYVFGLKEGLLSTKLEKRKYEFIEEKRNKAKLCADVIIYIDPEIVIPMEVERFQNIKAGEKQIIDYQLDWNEKSNRRYGILTDGFLWRFYINNEYREFTLNDLLEKTSLFMDFWKEYVKPEFYYLSFFEKKGQQSLLQDEEILYVEEYRQIFFEDVTKLIRSFKNKLQIEGYLAELGKAEKEKTAVELTYAYIIQFILYKTLVDNEFGKFKKEFEDRQDTIFESLKANQYGEILGVIGGISSTISKNIYRPFSKEQNFINNKLLELMNQPKKQLHDVSPWLDIFVFIKKYNFANVRNDIFGYIYENYLKELYEQSKLGQYFTDPAIVNFMLEQIGYTKEELKKRVNNEPEEDNISIIDPSCGSGTFLYSAVDKIIEAVPDGSEKASQKIEEIINENVFGLDIAEFPLYLAEMSILMRMLPLIINEKYNNPIDKKIKLFKTKDSIAEFINDALDNTENDIQAKGGQRQLFNPKSLKLDYASYMREEKDLTEMKKSMQPPRRRFDYVIGNPPYISYNESSKQGVLVFKLMKQGIKLSDIYGVNLHSIPDNRKKYSPKPNLYAFFIALGLSLLKDNGKLCYIIPQTILTAGDLDVLRHYLSEYVTIEKIITFSGKMFIGRGLRQNSPVATSSLIFVVKKAKPSLKQQVEIIHYKDADDAIETCLENILIEKKIIQKKIFQNKLATNVANWNFIKQDKVFLDFYDEYKKNSEDISIYYNHVLAEKKFGNKFYFDIGFSLDKKEVLEKPSHTYEVLDFKSFYGYSIFEPHQFYPRDTRKIKLTQNSQGYVSLEQKYKIVWSIKNPKLFEYTDHDIIFYMGKACIICSNNKDEILYLMFLLNSQINKWILMSNLKNENEKDYLIPIKAIKEYICVPKISVSSLFIKEGIIKTAGLVVELENYNLGSYIDFSSVLQQKFDGFKIKGNDLVLIKDDKEIKCAIKNNVKLVKSTLEVKFENDKLFKDKIISLSDLKSMPVIDFEKQAELKDYIDDLVFALYFNVPIKKVGLNRAEEIKVLCKENKFYKVIEKFVEEEKKNK